MMSNVDNLDDSEEKKLSSGSFGEDLLCCEQWWQIVRNEQVIS